MQVCDACRQPNSSDARFCSRCGARLSAASTVRELRKTVTVVFCDLVESTRLGERLDSEALRRVMGEFYERLGTVLKRHGDPAQHLAGDAVIAFFGIPTVGEDDA